MTPDPDPPVIAQDHALTADPWPRVVAALADAAAKPVMRPIDRNRGAHGHAPRHTVAEPEGK